MSVVNEFIVVISDTIGVNGGSRSGYIDLIFVGLICKYDLNISNTHFKNILKCDHQNVNPSKKAYTPNSWIVE